MLKCGWFMIIIVPMKAVEVKAEKGRAEYVGKHHFFEARLSWSNVNDILAK